MANNVFKIKRTSISGRAANTSTLTNPGELALNMTDGIMYSTNGSSVFEVGANNTNVNISNTITLKAISANGSVGTSGQVLTSNGSSVYWATSSGSSYVRQSFTGDGSTTSFTVSGGYTPNNIDVYVNGVKTAPSEITIASGTAVVFGVAPLNGSVIEVIGVIAGTITYTTTNTSAQFTWSNTQTFTNTITFSSTINGTANNASFLGGTAAASYQLNSTLNANIAVYLPTYTGVVNASSLTVGSIVIGNSTILRANGFVANSTGVFDSLDNLRSIPVFAQTAAYVLTSSDNGETISTNAGVTVNGAVLTPNQVFTVFNNSSANITITAGTNTTIYQAGTANTGNRTLQQRGIATILMISANTFVISGAGLA